MPGREYSPQIDPHAVINARMAARAKNAGDAQALRMQNTAARKGQSPLNIDTTRALKPAMAPTMNGAAQKAWEMARSSPASANPNTAAPQPVQAPPVVNTPPPQFTAPGVTTPAEMARIASTYGTGGAADITPPTSVLQPGNPNALRPGQYWQRPGVDPRAGSTVPAPGGITERVSSLPGKGGGNIVSMYRPNVYNGPGESPTGIVHNNAPAFHEDNKAQAAMIAANPDLPIHIANSPANLAFVQAYHATNDPQKALAAARAAHQTASATSPLPPAQETPAAPYPV